jgi:glycosyltransferase involved in cell wall biosynthesis
MSTFSIVIPYYNNQNQVKLCLESIIKFFKINKNKFEIILVDDASKKYHYNQIKKYIKKNLDYKIYIIRNKKNLGPAKSRNVGAFRAKFKYIFFLDSDTALHDDICGIILQNLKKNDIIVGHYHFKPLNHTLASNFKAIYNYTQFSSKGLVKFETFNAACAIIKKKIFFEFKGFNEKIKWGMDYENEELGRRIIKKYKIILVPSLTVKHCFPNLFKMFKLYFKRAIPYVGVIIKDKKLENTGPGNLKMIYSILFSVLTTLSLIVYYINNEIFYLLSGIFFFSFFLITNIKFFITTIKLKPSYLINFIVLKFILSHVLLTALIFGLINYLLKKIDNK